VHHALRDAFVVEVRDLLAQVVVLEQDRSPGTGLERVVGVAQPYAPCWPFAVVGAPVSTPVGVRVWGAPCSVFGGSGSWGEVGSSTVGGALPGAPGTSGVRASAIFSEAVFTTFLTASAGLLDSTWRTSRWSV
jgi:hypothetical protein